MSKKKHTKIDDPNGYPVYLDCNATSPMDERVCREMVRYMTKEFGNAGSRTHEFGARAKEATEQARDQVAAVVGALRQEVIFTSGATESNNVAILGLSSWGRSKRRLHILSTQIEHKAVLEPLAELGRRGFDVELLAPNRGGWVEASRIRNALRAETFLVSVMHANNETGVVQPIDEIAHAVRDHEAYFHVDAAQTFGKLIEPLRNKRIDLISASAHKVYGPKGVGGLIARTRNYQRPPLEPLFFGGGQERGVRPGTLPVPLIVGFGLAADIALKEHESRTNRCRAFRRQLESALRPLHPVIHGDPERVLPHVINVSFPGRDSEAIMLAVKDEIAISNGSACTSSGYTKSHVLTAMGISEEEIMGAVRLSWCHLTERVGWRSVIEKLRAVG